MSDQTPAPPVDPAAPTEPAPDDARKPVNALESGDEPADDWRTIKGEVYVDRFGKRRVRPHWLHNAAGIAKSWAQVGQLVTEAEYDEAIAHAGGVQLQ